MARTTHAISRISRWAAALPLFLALAAAQPAFAQAVILPEGMAIQLETRQDISSKSAHAGDQVELAVAKAVTIGGATIIAAGSPAVGEVTRVRDNGLLGRSGKLDIKVSVIKAGALEVPVRGQRKTEGKSGRIEAMGAGIVFLPLAVIVRGKDVKLPAGTAFEVYVEREITIPSATAPEPGPASPDQTPAVPIRTIDPNEAVGS